MKTKLFTLLCFLPLSFLNANLSFEADIECKKCHPTIYKEHQGAMHNNSTIFKDPIHKAVWDKHPANLKKKANTSVQNAILLQQHKMFQIFLILHIQREYRAHIVIEFSQLNHH
ncbi:MAG: hypothetical protein Q9M43_15070 [Sulfurimonas sp.]|nr:hypothetical protein [Sulfurimonas sp.]